MTLLATPATQSSDVALRLRRLIRIAAEVYGVRPADLGPGRQGRYGTTMPAWLEARYAVLQIVVDRRMCLFGDAVRALGFSNCGSVTINCAGMREYRRLRARQGRTAALADDIEARFDSWGEALTAPVTVPTGVSGAPDRYGPRQVSAQRLRDMRRTWTIKGLCRQFEIDEPTMRAILKEPVGASL